MHFKIMNILLKIGIGPGMNINFRDATHTHTHTQKKIIIEVQHKSRKYYKKGLTEKCRHKLYIFMHSMQELEPEILLLKV